MNGVKISISLPEGDIAFVDEFVRAGGFQSRSAVLHRAVELLRAENLSQAYEDAWREWDDSGEASTWEPATADGLN